MQKFFALLFSCMTLLSAGQKLIPFKKNDLWGYCTPGRKMVIEPQYQSAGFFKQGYALARKDNKSLLIDSTGKVHLSANHIYGTDWWAYGLTIVQKEADGPYQLFDIKTKTAKGTPYKIISEQVHEGISKASDDGIDYFLINSKGEKLASHPDWEKTSTPFAVDAYGNERYYIDYRWLWEGKAKKFRLKGEGKGPLFKYHKVINKDSFNYVYTGYARYNKIFATRQKEDDGFIKAQYYLLDTNGHYLDVLPYSRFEPLGAKYYYYTDTSGQEHIYNLDRKLIIDSVQGMKSISQDVLVSSYEKSNRMAYRYTDLNTGKVIWSGSCQYCAQTPMVNGKAFVMAGENEYLQVNRNGKAVKRQEFHYENYNLYVPGSPDKFRPNMDEVSRFRFMFKYDTLVHFDVVDYNEKTRSRIRKNRVYSDYEEMNEKAELTGKRILNYEYCLPNIYKASIPRAKDTLVILESIYMPLDDKGKEVFEVTTDGYNQVPIDKTGYWVLDLDGNLVMEFMDHTLKIYEDGKLKAPIENVDDFYYDERSNLFFTSRGYISLDGKIFYFD